MTIGEKLKIKREAANMSQKTLADKIGVNSAMIISNWELNKSTIMPIMHAIPFLSFMFFSLFSC